MDTTFSAASFTNVVRMSNKPKQWTQRPPAYSLISAWPSAARRYLLVRSSITFTHHTPTHHAAYSVHEWISLINMRTRCIRCPALFVTEKVVRHYISLINRICLFWPRRNVSTNIYHESDRHRKLIIDIIMYWKCCITANGKRKDTTFHATFTTGGSLRLSP